MLQLLWVVAYLFYSEMFKNFCCLLLCCFSFQLLHAQDSSLYRQDYLSKEFHAGRRAALREKMPSNSVAIFFSAPVRNRSNDVDYDYHQDPDFYYLTGLTEPNSLLLLFKEEQKLDTYYSSEYLFVQEKDPKKEIWTGLRLGKEGVRKKLGVDAVLINKAFSEFKIDFSKYTYVLTTTQPYEDCEDASGKKELNELVKTFKLKVKYQQPNINNKMLSLYMKGLREVKTKEELALMQKAIDATCLAQIEVFKALVPGMTEYQVQAILEYVFKHNGCEAPAFPSIVGGGENSCILHYISNNKKLLGKDMLVVDIGGEYHGYAADVTRTIPVDGSFSAEEKTIYELVLEAQLAGIEACTPGKAFFDPDKAAKEVIKKGLLKLGIIKQENDFKKYFMHGTSHYLGLDVHDVGNYGKLSAGNVITVEPGIYIPEGSDCDPKWWNIGVRIEDDVLITDQGKGNVVLSQCVPKTVTEIEAIMKQQGATIGNGQ